MCTYTICKHVHLWVIIVTVTLTKLLSATLVVNNSLQLSTGRAEGAWVIQGQQRVFSLRYSVVFFFQKINVTFCSEPLRPIGYYTLNDYETIAGCNCFICAWKCFACGKLLVSSALLTTLWIGIKFSVLDSVLYEVTILVFVMILMILNFVVSVLILRN